MTRFLLALVGVLLVAGLAACGGKSGSTASTSSLPTEPPNPNAGPVSGFQRHVQSLGEPAAGADRAQITAAVKGFYDAYAAVDGAKGCAFLTAAARRAVVESFGHSPKLRGKGCGPALASEMAKVPPQFRKLDRTVEVTGARIKGDRGYALFRSIAVLPSELPIRREGGAWKLDSIVASPLRG
jgi:hypothetical protein